LKPSNRFEYVVEYARNWSPGQFKCLQNASVSQMCQNDVFGMIDLTDWKLVTEYYSLPTVRYASASRFDMNGSVVALPVSDLGCHFVITANPDSILFFDCSR
jgi:hypothetical protein